MSLQALMTRRHPRRPDPPSVYPALKIPQHTDVFTSNSYRSAPASEFRNSIGVTGGFSGPNYPNSTNRAFWLNELAYLGIRHLRYTPVTNDGNHLQMARDWSNKKIGTLGTGKLLIEPGYLTNDWAQARGCTGVKQSGSFRTIDYVMNLLLGDAQIRKGIDVFELLNEPNNFQCDKFVAPPAAVCDPNWQDQYGLTWLECLGEYCKKVWNYVQTDPRAAGMKTVAPSPTNHYLRDSQIGSVPDGADVFSQWGDVAQYCHYGSDHPYCGFLLPGKTFIYNTKHEWNGGPSQPSAAGVPNGEGFPGVVRGQGFFPQRRGMITEFGYNTLGKPGVTPDGSTNQQSNGWAFLPDFEVFGNYWLRTHLEAFIRGHERFYFFKMDNEGDGLPRTARGAPDDFTPYTWNGTGTSGSVTNWNIRTEAVECMHRMTTTVGEGTSQPNIQWSVPSPHSSLRWLMLRRDVPSTAHVMFLWRYTSFLKQTGVALDNHDASKAPASVVVPSPITAHVNLPNATQVIETHPVDGAPDTALSFTGSGAGRGVDVTLAEKPVLLVIDRDDFSPGVVGVA